MDNKFLVSATIKRLHNFSYTLNEQHNNIHIIKKNLMRPHNPTYESEHPLHKNNLRICEGDDNDHGIF